MKSNYTAIIEDNLAKLFSRDLTERCTAMAADQQDREVHFKAFGAQCRIAADGIYLEGEAQTGPLGIILSLYALHAVPDAPALQPFKAFKEFPNSMPYVGAFASHTEQILIPAVDRIMLRQQEVLDALDGDKAPAGVGGDGAIVVRPLPKISLCYIFYEADEDFPASVTCLYSNNADLFMPMDGLADVGEYTSRAMLDLLS